MMPVFKKLARQTLYTYEVKCQKKTMPEVISLHMSTGQVSGSRVQRCDGKLYVSTMLGFGHQLFGQTPV